MVDLERVPVAVDGLGPAPPPAVPPGGEAAPAVVVGGSGRGRRGVLHRRGELRPE